jgi:hypothetical protein
MKLLGTIGAWLLASFPVSASGGPLDGSWSLESYTLQGKEVPVSGVMIFRGSFFASVYSMSEPSGKGARGHGGTYRVEGEVVKFSVPWWVEVVSGAPSVRAETAEAGARFTIEKDALTLRFDSGSVQKLRRVASADDARLEGGWRMESYRGRAAVGPAEGLILFADGRFALVYTMKEPGGRLAGRAHGGEYRTENETLTLSVFWSLQLVSGEGSVAEESSQRKIRIQPAGDRLTLEFDNGSVQQFRREAQ